MKKFLIIYAFIVTIIVVIWSIKIYKNQNIYNYLPQINSYNALQGAFKEDIGDSLIEGQVIAINPVDGQYSYLKKRYEVYETHVHTVNDGDGKSHTETSHSWETYKTEEFYANYWQFYDLKLPITQLPFVCHIRTEKTDSKHRIVQEGCNYIYNCTIRGDIKNNYINNPTFYFDKTIEQVIYSKTSYIYVIIGAVILTLIGIGIYFIGSRCV